jgi:hypothetical protein
LLGKNRCNLLGELACKTCPFAAILAKEFLGRAIATIAGFRWYFATWVGKFVPCKQVGEPTARSWQNGVKKPTSCSESGLCGSNT